MKRLLPDTFSLLLVGAVLLASLLPISGEPAAWFGIATNIAIALLFFLHGARLSTDTVVAGFLHWRLQLFILVTTFVIFPLLGLGLGLFSPWLIDQPIYLGLLSSASYLRPCNRRSPSPRLPAAMCRPRSAPPCPS